MMFISGNSNAEISIGEPAPAFKLQDQNNETRQLSDYNGKWVVIYFYPKDDTPGCTTEACHFRDDIYKIRALNAEIIGVSIDDSSSHAKFSDKYGLPFPLLADTDGTVAKSYGCLWSLGPVKIAKRNTFIIGPDGNLAQIYRKVGPAEHSIQIINDLVKLQQKK